MHYIWQITHRLHSDLSAPLAWLEQIEAHSESDSCHCWPADNNLDRLRRLLGGVHGVLDTQANCLLFMQHHLLPLLQQAGQTGLAESLAEEQRRLIGLNVSAQGLAAAPERMANNLDHWDELADLSRQLHQRLLRYLQRIEMEGFPQVEKLLTPACDGQLVRTFHAITGCARQEETTVSDTPIRVDSVPPTHHCPPAAPAAAAGR